MGLKRSVVLTVGAVLAASVLLTAATPQTSTSKSNASAPTGIVPNITGTDSPNTLLTSPGLATVDGIFAYCEKVDSKSAATYQATLNGITQGHSAAEVSRIRGSQAYILGLVEINLQLSKIAANSGIPACRAFAGQGRQPIATPVRAPFGSAKF